jgi:hypothetical protein
MFPVLKNHFYAWCVGCVEEMLMLNVQDRFQRLLLHGVCEVRSQVYR